MYCLKSGELPLLELTADDVFSAEIMVTRSSYTCYHILLCCVDILLDTPQVTTYQKQYFYTQTIEHAIAFVRDIANNVQRPFGVRYNPYTQSVDVLNNQVSSALYRKS